MARLLHISDLHLGPTGAWPLGDYAKTEVVAETDRLTRHDLLRGTLDALSTQLRNDDVTLDAVVISGDISYHGLEDGLRALPELLSHLGDAYPGPARTVVVPGNHDVTWRTTPDSTERYELFLRHIRQAGFVTPLLEGIDIAADDGTTLGDPHEPLLDLEDAVIVPVNSSNHCGTLEHLAPLTGDDLALLTEQAATNAPLASLLQRFDELRVVDVCRISKGQTEALSTRLRALEADGRRRLKIVVLHHQLLPVNVEEEVRPYETMVNLGYFRQWLAHTGAHLVLHGHKHSSGAYLDLPATAPILAPGQRIGDGIVMVSSVATANSERPPEIARLIEIASPGPTARSVTVHAVPATYPNLTLADLPTVAAAVVPLEPCTSRLRVFEGTTIDAVYHQLLAAFPQDSYEPTYDVMCRVSEGATGLHLPGGYPVPDGEDPDTWFAETIAWWQNPEPQLVAPQFNHGQRISRAAHNTDQFELAMAQLRRPGTSRAVILLVDPQAGQESLYPALCLIQLRIPAGTSQVDCVAYFRKQQMRAWWPINVGELAHLQQRALEDLPGHTPGEILTISAVAIGGSDRPRAAVPRIDRWSQDTPGELWHLVLATLTPDHPDRANAMATWTSLFSDWRPGPTMERDGVPMALRGINALADAVELCARSMPNPHVDALVADLRDLAHTNHLYWRDDSNVIDDTQRPASYANWQPVAANAIDRILGHVRTILTEATASSPSD